MKKRYSLIIGIIIGLITLIFIIMLYGLPGPSFCQINDCILNKGCSDYARQTPQCSSLNTVTVNWKDNLDYSFTAYMYEKYGCSDENCIKKLCACPGY